MNQHIDLDALFEKALTCIKDNVGRIEVNPLNDEPFDLADPAQVALLKQRFIKGRTPKAPSTAQTPVDPALWQVLQACADTKQESSVIDAIVAADRLVGVVLKHYLAAKLEPQGWIWLSGNILQGVDFVYHAQDKSTDNPALYWVLVQVNNRDDEVTACGLNADTDILQWCRICSQTGDVNWNKFPLQSGAGLELSENDFDSFIERYLNELKTAH